MSNWNGGKIRNESDFYNSKLEKRNIGRYNKDRVTIFGANMVMARHLPATIDGLKPVSRRTLTSIYRIAKNKAVTMPNAISETMRIHPHGDSSIYECIINMAAPWKKMIPMIDSMGENYGGAAGFGDTAADARYLKTKLSDYAVDCFFSDYDESVIEMKSSFDGSSTEPLYLPAKYPNIFINGENGMAWGYSTEIPMYNITDILEYTIHLIKNSNKKFRDIIPDSPTGCDIIEDLKTFENLQFNGFNDNSRSHVFIMQSEIEIDEKNNSLIVKSFPVNRTTENFFKEVDKMKESNILTNCIKIKNECQGDIIKIILCFKPGSNLEKSRELLFGTKLGTRVPIAAQITTIDIKNSSNLLINRYSVQECLLEWINYRRDFKRRFYHKKIVMAKSRIHQLIKMLLVFSKDNLEKTMKIIKNSESKEDLINNLIHSYDIDTVQAVSIANMRQYENVKNVRKKYRQELEKLKEESDQMISLVSDLKKIDEIIIKELEEGIKKYGQKRKSRIILEDKEDNLYDLIITKDKRFKKVNFNSSPIEENIIKIYKAVNNSTIILLFNISGIVYPLNVKDIPLSDISVPGYPISQYTKDIISLQLIQNGVIDFDTLFQYGYFVIITNKGYIKKTSIHKYFKITKSSYFIKLIKDDYVRYVRFIPENEKDKVLSIITDKKVIRIKVSDIPETNRNVCGNQITTDAILNLK